MRNIHGLNNLLLRMSVLSENASGSDKKHDFFKNDIFRQKKNTYFAEWCPLGGGRVTPVSFKEMCDSLQGKREGQCFCPLVPILTIFSM